jgi:hypothetical protein
MKKLALVLVVVLLLAALLSVSGCVSGKTVLDSESNDHWTPGTVVDDPPANWDGTVAPEDLFQPEPL